MRSRTWTIAMGLGVLSSGIALGQVTVRVSVGSAGEQANGWSVTSPISADGRYVAFESVASNLVATDMNHSTDVFVRDRQTGTIERMSVSSSGMEGIGHSYNASISADGACAAFRSEVATLVPGDTNGSIDVFIRDRLNVVTSRVSVDSSGAQANGDSDGPSMSADGRFVAFMSAANNLVPGDQNGEWDVFVRDRSAGTTELVSIATSGSPGNGQSSACWISASGRYVAFESMADDLVPGDTNAARDVFVRDLQTSTTERVSTNSSGAQGIGFSAHPKISADGRYVAFGSLATNLVPGDTNDVEDVFVHDRHTGLTTRVSVDSSGVQGNWESFVESISADGRYVGFSSPATNLVSGDTNGNYDAFVRDLLSGATERVSVASDGGQASFYSSGAYLSADGRYVAFTSGASDLVPGDTNGEADIFLRDRFGGTSFTSLCDPGVAGVIACPCANPAAGPGRGCDNSAATGGALLTASGATVLSSDSLVFATSAERPGSLSLVLQGTSPIPTGIRYGQGVRCVGGSLKRLYTKTAAAGTITAPDFDAGDSTVSALSAARGNPIQPGQRRWYLVYYRDPVVLGGCTAANTFNATQSGEVLWSP